MPAWYISPRWREALACDDVSAFGGIVAVNVPLDGPTAEAICEIFTEVVVAPDADAAAREAFAKKKNLRLLLTGDLPNPRRGGLAIKPITGGLLVQTRDNGAISQAELKVVTQRAPTEQELKDCLFAWTVARHVKSNAIVYAKDGSTAGVGAGQMNRLESARIAAWNEGNLPIYEPGLEEYVERNQASGRLTFTTDVGAASAWSLCLAVNSASPAGRPDSAASDCRGRGRVSRCGQYAHHANGQRHGSLASQRTVGGKVHVRSWVGKRGSLTRARPTAYARERRKE